jgi:uncharacterized protein YcbX
VEIRVSAIHVSPVKSLRLVSLDGAMLTERGIPGDRAFVVVDPTDERTPFVTMRKAGRLAQAVAAYDPVDGRLSITVDGQEPLVGEPIQGGAHTVQMWGREVTGHLVDGPWAHALSLLSQESCAELGRRNGQDAPDARRFRPSILLAGAGPHAEDGWIGREVRIGKAVLRVVEKDSRCSLTTRNPDTGERDLDTLRMIAAYRPPEGSEVCFGVYAEVVAPGHVRVGDVANVIGEG